MEDKYNTKEYGECRCCLSKGNHRNIMKEYFHDGEREIYVELFLNCMNLDLSKDPRLTQLICSECVHRLKEVDMFRKLVVETEQHLLSTVDDGIVIKEDTSIEFEDNLSDDEFTQSDNEVLEIKHTNIIIEDNKESIKPMMLPKSKKLTKLSKSKEKGKTSKDKNIASSSKKTVQIMKTPTGRNIMILAKPSEIKEAVKTPKRERRKATETKKKLSLVSITKTGHPPVNWIKKQLLPNLLKMIQHSTILPFRNYSYFYCFFCKSCFVSFQQLREHFQSEHKEITVRDIKLGTNNLIKVDIGNLKCKLCSIDIKSVEELIEHLKNHNVQFHDTPNKLSSFFLGFDMSTDQLKCHICGKEFRFFKPLCKHMSDHCGSYICDLCGKRCTTRMYLDNHKKYGHGSQQIKDSSSKYQRDYIKSTGVQCPMCPQTFCMASRYVARLKHMATVHGV